MDIRRPDDAATMPSLAEVLQIDADAAVQGDTALRAPARLLEFDWKRYVALPIHTTLEIVERPEIVPVPGAPYYGLGMLRWQGRFLAVLNLCALLNAYPKAGAPSP